MRVWGLLVVAVALSAIGVLGVALWTMRVLNRATVRLYRGDPDAFLEAVDKLRPWTFTRRGRELITLNEAVGLFWKGAFARARQADRARAGAHAPAHARGARRLSHLEPGDARTRGRGRNGV